MDWKKQNANVYDKSATEFSKHFTELGPRVEDIERGLMLAGRQDGARVIELGCGDGRDAFEIIKRVKQYEGIDSSEGLLDIAKKKNPKGTFVLNDAISYEYPKKLDTIFAFASLLHLDQNDIYEVFEKASRALRLGGIFYISLKERSQYIEKLKKDKYGERMFYFYNPEIIKHLAGKSFESIYEDHQKHGDEDWFTIALKKKSV